MSQSPARVWCSVLVVAAVLACTSSRAQERGEPAAEQTRVVSGPEAAFEKFMDAMQGGDWAGCSRMMHREALAEFHATFSALAQADETGEVARMFFGLERGEDVGKLPPHASFERAMQGIVALNPVMSEMFGSATAKILGSVTEGDTVHVVYRMSMELEGTSVSKIAVAPFKQDRGEWRALLTGDMQGMIQAVQRQMGN